VRGKRRGKNVRSRGINQVRGGGEKVEKRRSRLGRRGKKGLRTLQLPSEGTGRVLISEGGSLFSGGGVVTVNMVKAGGGAYVLRRTFGKNGIPGACEGSEEGSILESGGKKTVGQGEPFGRGKRGKGGSFICC